MFPATGAPMPPPSPSRNVLVSPVRRTMSVDGLVSCLFLLHVIMLRCGSMINTSASPATAAINKLRLLSTKVDGSSVKKERNGMTMERKQQKLLEREVLEPVLLGKKIFFYR